MFLKRKTYNSLDCKVLVTIISHCGTQVAECQCRMIPCLKFVLELIKYLSFGVFRDLNFPVAQKIHSHWKFKLPLIPWSRLFWLVTLSSMPHAVRVTWRLVESIFCCDGYSHCKTLPNSVNQSSLYSDNISTLHTMLSLIIILKYSTTYYECRKLSAWRSTRAEHVILWAYWAVIFSSGQRATY